MAKKRRKSNSKKSRKVISKKSRGSSSKSKKKKVAKLIRASKSTRRGFSKTNVGPQDKLLRIFIALLLIIGGIYFVYWPLNVLLYIVALILLVTGYTSKK